MGDQGDAMITPTGQEERPAIPPSPDNPGIDDEEERVPFRPDGPNLYYVVKTKEPRPLDLLTNRWSLREWFNRWR